MKIENWQLDRIQPYENNPRVNDAGVGAVAKSIQEFGFRQPIVVDKTGTIVIGHTRWLAARQLGLKTVPVHVARELSPAQIKALRIADNKLHELSGWDFDRLSDELAELETLGVDLDVLGFSTEELAGLFGETTSEGLIDPDFIPEPPEEARTQSGDLWILGEHRLVCGDAGQPEHVDLLLDGAPVHLVHTDPPYNVRVEPRSNNAVAVGNSSFVAAKPRRHRQDVAVARPGKKKATHKKLRPKDRPLENDFVSDDEFHRLLSAWFGQIARVLEPGRAFYLWGGYSNIGNYPPALKASGLYFSQAVIWHKQHPVLNRKDFMGDHEWCFYGWREGAAHQFFGPPNATDVWTVKKVSPQRMVHLTEKPVELAIRALQFSSRKNENVLDLFGGSGSTLIAAVQTGRRAFLMELDRLYCDVIVDRWERFTGQTAKRTEALCRTPHKSC